MPSAPPVRVLALMESQWVTGPAKNLIAFARRLREQPPAEGPAIDFSVAAFDRPSSPAERFLAALGEVRVPTHVIRERHAGDPRAAAQLAAIVRAVRPDILQTHNSKSHFLVRAMRLHRRMPWIAFFHGFTSRDARDRLYSRIGWWALRGAPHIVTVCGAFAERLVRAGVAPARITVRHNMVEPFVAPPPGEVEAARRELGLPAGARVVLAVGRLSAEKGHRDLLEAAALLRADGLPPAVRFVVAGDGPERGPLERQVRELGLGECVLLAGHRDGVRALYALANAFVLPSHSEGSPNALLEAMAAGLPIVSTDAGGAAELVSHGETALVVKPAEPAALAGALGRVLADGDLARRLGAAALRASEAYTPAAYCQALAGLYAEVAGLTPISTAPAPPRK